MVPFNGRTAFKVNCFSPNFASFVGRYRPAGKDRIVRDNHHKTTIGGIKSFTADARGVFSRYSKRTSVPHKRSIFLLILGGTVLRLWMLFEPITYDEARAYDLFIGRGISTIIGDYTDPLNHVLHSLLSKLSIALFGVNKYALRFPAFLAGILTMPLFYLFTRAMFNRYIAMLVLALVASSGPLVEYGTLAHGYSLTWLFMVLAFFFGRHFVKENNLVSALLIGVVLALGMWTMTSMIYPAVTVYIYLLLYILTRYQGSIKKRMNLLGLSFLVCLLLVIGFYLPIITHHGLGQLIDHPSLPAKSWKLFVRTHQDGAFNLWVAIADTTGSVIAMAGIAALLVSAFISIKFRLIMFAVALGSIPLVLMHARVGAPPVWFYTLYLFHIGSGIALFYLLKFIQEKVFSDLGKRVRTAITAFVLFAGLSYLAAMEIHDRLERYEEAASVGAYLYEAMGPGDKVYVDHPWDAPIRFHARQYGIAREQFLGMPSPDSWVFVAVSPVEGQGVMDVIGTQRMHPDMLDSLRIVKDWPRIEIFAARYRGGPSAGMAQ